MRVILFALLAATMGTVKSSWANEAEPAARYVFIGDFESGNPFKWDTEVVPNPYRGRYYGVALELDRGVEIEIREITVVCRNGRVCHRDRVREFVTRERPLILYFRRGLEVDHVRVESKPNGFSVPPPRVNVYLER